MKLLFVLLAATIGYIGVTRYFILDHKAQSEQDKKSTLMGQCVFAATVLYLVVVVKTTQLAYTGVLPLL